MRIEKFGKEVKKGLYKPYYKSVPSEGDNKKMKIRYNIEQQVCEDDPYDIYDMFADLANAFNEYKNGNPNGPANQKWDNRQEIIKKIIN